MLQITKPDIHNTLCAPLLVRLCKLYSTGIVCQESITAWIAIQINQLFEMYVHELHEYCMLESNRV